MSSKYLIAVKSFFLQYNFYDDILWFFICNSWWWMELLDQFWYLLNNMWQWTTKTTSHVYWTIKWWKTMSFNWPNWKACFLRFDEMPRYLLNNAISFDNSEIFATKPLRENIINSTFLDVFLKYDVTQQAHDIEATLKR